MKLIKIKIENISVEAEVYDTPTGEAILAALPLESRVTVWGEEIYFDVPVRLESEPDARETVAVGDLGYWPMGPAFCIFFGPTPVSQGTEPRAYSPVNVFGKVMGDATVLTQVADGALVQVTRI
jgi:hypothetical protein